MADAVLERWRERCKEAGRSGDGLPKRGRHSTYDYMFFMREALHVTRGMRNSEKAVARIGLCVRRARYLVIWNETAGLSLALRWLREEMERGDGS
jgi:hypothetical protein